MINFWAFDVEIFINLFSITFVNLKDYMRVFADCVDDKGKAIALTEKLSVSEIKSRLDKVESKIFKISDSDDSQLLELAAYINKMQAHYDTIEDKDGKIIQVPNRTDLCGFNSLAYDDLMIKAFMMNFNRYDTTKALIKHLYKFSKKIIESQNDKNAFYADKELETVRKYKLPYATVDVQQVYGLHSASVNVDKDGVRNKFPKSLKQTSINLKWHELLDFKLPPINEKEYELYWKTLDNYKGMTLSHINSLVTNDFDRYVLPEYENGMLHYNKNDVFIVCEMVRQKPDEVKLRYSITSAFGINVLSSARANIADKLTIKFYSDMSGLKKEQFIKGRTERTKLSFKRIIFPHITFKTPKLRALLEEMKTVSVYHTTKEDFFFFFTFYGTTYTLACGGIHTKDIPVILKSNDKVLYKHFD